MSRPAGTKKRRANQPTGGCQKHTESEYVTTSVISEKTEAERERRKSRICDKELRGALATVFNVAWARLKKELDWDDPYEYDSFHDSLKKAGKDIGSEVR